MCGNPFKPKVVQAPAQAASTPAAAPPPVAQSAAVAQGDVVREEGSNSDELQKARKKGRSSLRIKLDAGNTGGPTGLNVPQG